MNMKRSVIKMQKIFKISLNTDKLYPKGVYVEEEGTGKAFPVIYFKKPKGISNQEFDNWIQDFKTLYERNQTNE